MHGDERSHPTLQDLAGGLGEVQIYWCFLENEMRSQLHAEGSAEVLPKGPVIVHWRRFMATLAPSPSIVTYLDALETVGKMRNLLSHGIQSVSASSSDDDDAFVICIGPDGVSHRITLQGIRELSAEIDRVRHLTRNIVFNARLGR